MPPSEGPAKVEFLFLNPALTPRIPTRILSAMHRLSLFLAATLGLLGFSTTSSQAQVLVYKIDFGGAKGINFHIFEGGYIVAPLLGGTASFLLTSTEGGRTYLESADGGNFFTAVTGGGDRKAVLSATTGSGTAAGAMVALGDINHVIKVNSRTLTLAARVAKSLNGTIVSADDESTVDSTAVDNSIGSAGFADLKMSLDEGQTNSANKDGLTMAETITQLKTELERQGFSAADTGGVDPTPPTTTTTTTEATTTTTK